MTAPKSSKSAKPSVPSRGIQIDFAPLKSPKPLPRHTKRIIKLQDKSTRVKITVSSRPSARKNTRLGRSQHPQYLQGTPKDTSQGAPQDASLESPIFDQIEPAHADFNLDEVFDELEAANVSAQSLFADYENPLEHRTDNHQATPKEDENYQVNHYEDFQDSFLSEPEPLPELPETSPATSQPVPQSSPRQNSPFLTAVVVEKRPLSGGRAEFTSGGTDSSARTSHPQTAYGKTSDIQSAPTSAPSAQSASKLGLLAAIIVTVILGALVGALIYFLFFAQ